jgi:hypothetical protein
MTATERLTATELTIHETIRVMCDRLSIPVPAFRWSQRRNSQAFYDAIARRTTITIAVNSSNLIRRSDGVRDWIIPVIHELAHAARYAAADVLGRGHNFRYFEALQQSIRAANFALHEYPWHNEYKRLYVYARERGLTTREHFLVERLRERQKDATPVSKGDRVTFLYKGRAIAGVVAAPQRGVYRVPVIVDGERWRVPLHLLTIESCTS